MSLIKKSDVKNHLSARRNKRLLPFRLMSQPNTGNSGSGLLDTNPNVPGSRQVSGPETSSAVPPIASIDVLIGSAGSPVETSTAKKPQA